MSLSPLNRYAQDLIGESGMSQDALAQARALLEELTEAARKGAIIPIRLPGQLEAIAQALAKAQEPGSAQGNTPTGDIAAFMKDEAEFVSHAVHDLRLPLTSIRGYSDMLGTPGMGELSAMQQQFINTIKVNSRRMEALLTDVSDMAKIRARTLKMTPKMDMFKNIAMMVEKNVRAQVQELNRNFVVDIPQGMPLLNVDGELLAKALTKLVENALRYTPQDDNEIKLTGAADGSTLHMLVQDNGVGMTPEEIAKLGTLYFRGDNEVVQNHKGSGLGIPIAYGIIELLGGQVAVASRPGQGATFTVTMAGLA
jgi:signal transduction histidine kinase